MITCIWQLNNLLGMVVFI